MREIVRSVEQVTGREVPVREAPRRIGDPPMVVANSTKLKTGLGWRPRFFEVDEIVRSAFEWERALKA